MAKTRKTIERLELVTSANELLTLIELTPDQRKAVNMLVNHVLIGGNAYKGYTYQASEMAREGGLREGYDDTKRVWL